ncbi:MAG: hypothetical protein ACJ71C_13480, partial [Nitrososphaeraceae archaeon]
MKRKGKSNISEVYLISISSLLAYVHPEVLVDTQWVEDHLKDPKVRVAEVDYDREANYVLGHAPGAV